MRKKSLFISCLSLFLSISCISSIARAEARLGFTKSSGNIAIGDYVVINNESYTQEENIGRNPNVLENAEKYKQDENGNYQIDLNLNNIKIENEGSSNNILNNVMLATNYVKGDKKQFYTLDTTNNKTIQITATLLYSGINCDVWVNDSKITEANATAIGQEFDNKIFPSVKNNFSDPTDVDGNNKINLLCFDIKDGFSGSGQYVAGYFYSIDLYAQSVVQGYGYNSNESEMLYIDTYPSMYSSQTGTVNTKNSYGTMAHEMQHLVNFARNVGVEGGKAMPVWINEGLAEAADQIYSGTPSTSRINYYNSSTDITNGHSLTTWNNQNSLPNYSLSYLFFQYLKIQCGKGDVVFKEIINSSNNTEKAVEEVIKKYIDSNKTLGQFISDFRMALFLNDKYGLHGFKNTAGFTNIAKKTLATTPTSVALKPGASVVVKGGVNKAYQIPADKGSDIRYFGTDDSYNKGNFNRDGKIDTVDLAQIALKYNNQTTALDWNLDSNYDGIFDIYDIVKVAREIK